MARKRTITDRRGEILQAAERLFTHYSYEKTTMEDISKAAGIPRATIYLEFPGGKEDILMANVADFLEKMLADMQETVANASGSVLAALQKALLHHILSAHNQATHQFDPSNVGRYSSRIKTEMGDFFSRRAIFYANTLKKAAEQGEMSANLDFGKLAQLIGQCSLMWMPLHTISMPREVLEEAASVYFKIFFTGLSHYHN